MSAPEKPARDHEPSDYSERVSYIKSLDTEYPGAVGREAAILSWLAARELSGPEDELRELALIDELMPILAVVGAVDVLQKYGSAGKWEARARAASDLAVDLRGTAAQGDWSGPGTLEEVVSEMARVVSACHDRASSAEARLAEHGYRWDAARERAVAIPGESGGRPTHFMNKCAEVLRNVLKIDESRPWVFHDDDTIDSVCRMLRTIFGDEEVDRDRIQEALEKRDRRLEKRLNARTTN